MAAHSHNDHTNGKASSPPAGVTFAELPKSNNFTSKLPPDPLYPTPASSHKAPRQKLGPRQVRDALFTYVRPEPTENPELLGFSSRALSDIGLLESESGNEELKNIVCGRKILWDEEKEEGIYPWAQCYGGFQFGQWAGQLGDGRAISLFETTNPATKKRYELQLKGAGKTPYSRFADGKAVLRSSIREYVVSEALNALHIPTTRALSLTLCSNGKNTVARERMEPAAIVCRFAESWLRIGTFDLMRSRGDRDLVRKTATYVAEEVFPGWESLPGILPKDTDDSNTPTEPTRGVAKDEIQGSQGEEQNRFTRLYREIVRRNAKTVAAWQAYGFMNGVLNTDNTSIFGLSLDFGPFAFLDNFDPTHTPNHDDHMLRYCYRAQPTVIWWNLVRLGETFGELIGAGPSVDDPTFISEGVSESLVDPLIKRAETIIDQVGEEYKSVFLAEYRRLLGSRLGLKSVRQFDFDKLFSDLLDTMESLELDFNHFFRRLSSVRLADVRDSTSRSNTAARFFHHEGITALNETEQSGKEKLGKWLEQWYSRIQEDWPASSSSSPSTSSSLSSSSSSSSSDVYPSEEEADLARAQAMKSVNPNFVPRGWILDEVIDRVQNKGDRTILGRVTKMASDPFRDEWDTGDGTGAGIDGEAEEEEEEEGAKEKEEQKRFCGDVPRYKRSLQCSCSS